MTVVAYDTDILVLLLYHFNISMADFSLRSDSKTSFISIVSIRDIHQKIGEVAAKQLLVMHAIGGCDTTSAIYGRTKVGIWKMVTKTKSAVSLTDMN